MNSAEKHAASKFALKGGGKKGAGGGPAHMPLVRVASLCEEDPNIVRDVVMEAHNTPARPKTLSSRPRVGSESMKGLRHRTASTGSVGPTAAEIRRLRRGVLDWSSVAVMSVMEVLEWREDDEHELDVVVVPVIDNMASLQVAGNSEKQDNGEGQIAGQEPNEREIVSPAAATSLEVAAPAPPPVAPKKHSRRTKRRRRTKIVCAIGPASREVETLVDLLEAGMNVARLNFSHGDHAYHAQTIKNLQEAIRLREERSGAQCHCAILMDTKGPEIRTGMLKDHEPVELVTGQLLEITTDYTLAGTSSIVACSYKELCASVRVGGLILIADGSIQTRVEEIRETSVMVRVENDAILEERKNMNLPGVSIRLPGITAKDKYDLENFALNYPVDIVSGSFIRTAANVRAVRACLGERGKHIRVHAKIESVEALRNIEEIIEEADGVHVSRGDLGMELPLSKLFLAQKGVIRWANLAGKPVVTSTQMLDSMTTRPRPTNAECSDVANAVLDGTDCVMLSAETAKGMYPRESVATMGRIISEAERVINYESYYSTIRAEVLSKGKVSVVEALASSAVETSLDVRADLIVVVSDSGDLARLVAKYRPTARIVVVTSNRVTAHHMSVCRGVSAMLLDEAVLSAPREMWLHANKYILDRAWARVGAMVTLVTSLYDIKDSVKQRLDQQPNKFERLSNTIEVRKISLDAYETMVEAA
ncbi:Pyruvate kinase [Hondaea fermentalgiana]|uniref:Pyruvate kinase n=1 Tax=Hondaea fermentalgiana TaxID=2315210 RepID=A0A2R5G8T7_9STRA|nr:Pyruvate kinase [Hondaea fermentalgiana]|eukprot:GBG27457.1 Pyruvate kinase [Hondaea fermentalgiana]